MQSSIPSYTNIFMTILRRELTLSFRRREEITNPLIFLVMVVVLFPIAVGPDVGVLSKIASGVIWVAALLSALLSFDRLFKNDFTDGSLEQMLLLPVPAFVVALGKILSHWMTTGLPIVVMSPLLALLMNLPENAYSTLILSLLLGTPIISFIGAIGAGLTVSLKQSGVLISLLVLPLFIPLIILATAAVEQASNQQSVITPLAYIGAMLVASFVLSPIVVGASLKVSVN